MEHGQDLDFVNNLLEKRNIKKKHKGRLERRLFEERGSTLQGKK